ncbi:hypothetical protein MASR2M70_20830 [Bacillota bacterium]
MRLFIAVNLTLAFLGECGNRETDAVKSVLRHIYFEPFEITIDCIGKFKRNEGDLWWAGLGGCNELESIRMELYDKLLEEGFELDIRKFSPHVTLGRQILTDIKPWRIEPFGETTDKIQLMKSERISGRLTYTPV